MIGIGNKRDGTVPIAGQVLIQGSKHEIQGNTVRGAETPIHFNTTSVAWLDNLIQDVSSEEEIQLVFISAGMVLNLK